MGKSARIVVLPGDGIGPEVAAAAAAPVRAGRRETAGILEEPGYGFGV